MKLCSSIKNAVCSICFLIALPLLLPAQQPDLVVTQMFASTTPGGFSFKFDLMNAGDLPADLDQGPGPGDNISFDGYLSADTNLDITTDTLVFNEPLLGILDPGTTTTITLEPAMVVDLGITPYFILVVDSADALAEGEEGNNQRITLFNAPDLIVSRFQVLSLGTSNYQFIMNIKNIGTGHADLNGANDVDVSDNVGLQNLFSFDEIYGGTGDAGAGGTFLFDPVPVLAPGEIYTYQGSFGLTNRNGHPYVVTYIDFAGKMEEANEDNNYAAALLQNAVDTWSVE